MKNPEPLFYIPVPHNDTDVAGPYDIVQMAQLLRKKEILAETPVYREGATDWKPFNELPQYIIAAEMPADAVSNRLVQLREQEEAKRPPIPVPSLKMVASLIMVVGLVAIAAAICFGLTVMDSSAGFVISLIGCGAALTGQAFILVHLLDEPLIVRAMVIFIPFFDLYYFLSNLEKYLFFFCAKYIGATLAAASLAALAWYHPEMSDTWQSIIAMTGLS